MNEEISNILEAIITPIISMSDVPQTPSNSTEALGALILGLINEWMLYSTPNSINLDRLIKFLKDPADPMVARLGPMERQMLWSTLNILSKERERRNAG